MLLRTDQTVYIKHTQLFYGHYISIKLLKITSPKITIFSPCLLTVTDSVCTQHFLDGDNNLTMVFLSESYWSLNYPDPAAVWYCQTTPLLMSFHEDPSISQRQNLKRENWGCIAPKINIQNNAILIRTSVKFFELDKMMYIWNKRGRKFCKRILSNMTSDGRKYSNTAINTMWTKNLTQSW